MSKNFGPRNWGTMVMSLAVLVSLLAAVTVKADLVSIPDVIQGNGDSKTIKLSGVQGKSRVSFETDSIQGSGYSFSRTYTLADPDAVFTMFSLDLDSINMNLRSLVNNVGEDFPYFDTSAIYTGTIGWEGSLSLSTNSWEKDVNQAYDESKGVTGIDYEADALLAGEPGMRTRSGEHPVFFDEFEPFSYDEAELAGAKEITFSFTLSDIYFDSSIEDQVGWGANLFAGWAGTIDGAFLVEWAAPGNATPEPTSILLFGLGLAGAGLVASRKRGAKK